MVEGDDETLSRGQTSQEPRDHLVAENGRLRIGRAGGKVDGPQVPGPALFTTDVVDQPTLCNGDHPSDRQMVDPSVLKRSHRRDEGLLGEILDDTPVGAASASEVGVDGLQGGVEEGVHDPWRIAGSHDVHLTGSPLPRHPHITFNERRAGPPSRESDSRDRGPVVEDPSGTPS